MAYLVKDVELLPKEGTYGLGIDRCPEGYEGIGIKRNFGGLVTQVAKGYPADRAGIKVGDVITPWNIDPVNGWMEFLVNGKPMKLRTERICAR